MFFFVLAGLGALLLLANAHFGTSLSYQLSAVASNSMKPAYRRGDLVAVAPAPAVVKGTAVVVRVPQDYQEKYGVPPLLMHRVVAVDEGKQAITTQGDANPAPDPFPSSLRSVVGTPVYRVPYAGWVLLFVGSRYGQIWLLIVFGLLIAFDISERLQMGWQTVQERFPALLGLNAPQKELAHIHGELSGFREAIAEYALHLKSHTSVLQHLDQTTARLEQAVGHLHGPCPCDDGPPTSGPPPPGQFEPGTPPAPPDSPESLPGPLPAPGSPGRIRWTRASGWEVQDLPEGLVLIHPDPTVSVAVPPDTPVYIHEDGRLERTPEGVSAISSRSCISVAYRTEGGRTIAVWVTLE